MPSCNRPTPRALARALVIAALLAFPCAPVRAADTPAAPADKLPPPPIGSELQLFIENDFLSGTDRYYTNGIKLGFGAPLGAFQQFLQAPSRWMLDLPSDENADYHFGLFVGQNLYTPHSIRVRTAQPQDRPWAAWLYLSGVAQRVQKNRLDTVEIDLGMVGPAALGKQVQTQWHQLVGTPRPRGWGNQLPNELAFLVSYVQKRRFGSGNIELIPHAGVTLGTVMTLARAGALVRVGRNMTGFGPDSIEPGGAMLQNTRRADGAAGRRADLEWCGFVGADFRLVAHNIFLDGTMFRGSPGVDRRNHVNDLTAGLSLRYKLTRLSLTRILRSEEFTAPVGGGKQRFYSLNLGLEF